MIATEDEIKRITKKIHHSSQAKVLNFMGIKYTARPDGSLVVSTKHVEHLLGEVYDSKPKSVEPNWSGLNA